MGGGNSGKKEKDTPHTHTVKAHYQKYFLIYFPKDMETVGYLMSILQGM